MRAEYQAALDCGRDSGAVLAGLRAGCKAIVFDGPPALRRKLAAIAATSEARLVKRPDQPLDLRHAAEPRARVAEWLARCRGG